MRRGAVLGLLLLLGGCKAVPPILGLVSGAVAGGASGNPAVAFGVGVGVDALSDYGLRWYGRTRQNTEQDAIAAVAGALPVGGTASWQVRHFLPYGNEKGELQIVRDIVNPLTPCREVAFSVVDGEQVARFTSTICRQDDRWKWASAEPAVPRWGNLQ